MRSRREKRRRSAHRGKNKTDLVVGPVAGTHRPLMLGLASARNRAPTRILEAFAEHCRAEITATRIPGMMPLG